MDDVLVVGEALVDIVRERRADGRAGEEHPGGSPANVALGLGRLGRAVSPAQPVRADDPRGRPIAGAAGRLRRGSSCRARVTTAPTSTATALLDGRGVASYDFDIDWRLPEDVERRLAAPGPCTPAPSPRSSRPAATPCSTWCARQRRQGDRQLRPERPARLMGEAGPRPGARRGVRRRRRRRQGQRRGPAWLAPGEDPADVAPRVAGARARARRRHPRRGRRRRRLCAAAARERPRAADHVVDTVGAGDAFTAGLLDALAAADLLGADGAGDAAGDRPARSRPRPGTRRASPPSPAPAPARTPHGPSSLRPTPRTLTDAASAEPGRRRAAPSGAGGAVEPRSTRCTACSGPRRRRRPGRRPRRRPPRPGGRPATGPRARRARATGCATVVRSKVAASSCPSTPTMETSSGQRRPARAARRAPRRPSRRTGRTARSAGRRGCDSSAVIASCAAVGGEAARRAPSRRAPSSPASASAAR